MWAVVYICARGQYLVTSRRFSPVFSTTKTDRHGLTEILLKVALTTLLQPKEMSQGQQFNQKINYDDFTYLFHFRLIINQ
jgi:hypothetical protein